MKDREMILDALTSGRPARVGIALLMAAGYAVATAVAATVIVGAIMGAAYILTATIAGVAL